MKSDRLRVEPFRVTVIERLSRRGRTIRAWVIDEHVSLLIAEGSAYSLVYAGEGNEPPAWTNNPDGDVLVKNEGITWCRGWKGNAVDALRVVQALT